MTRLGRVGGLALVVLALLAVPANAQEGVLDPSFGNGGYVLTPPIFRSGGALATAPDGDIFMVGSLSYADLVTPYHASGKLFRFASDGSSSSLIASTSDTLAKDVAVQPDGKVVVAGTQLGPVSEYPGDGDVPKGIVVRRYLPNGSPDTDFGDGGKTVILWDPPNFVYPGLGMNGLDLGSDGRIHVAGGNLVASLGSDGSVEQSYIGPGNWDIGAVAAGNDGSVVLAGKTWDTGNPVCCNIDDWLVRRLTENLTPDPTFTPPVLGSNSSARDLAMQSDGRLLVAGRASDGTGLVARLTATGAFDPTFSFVNSSGPGFPDAIALDQQQRILLTAPGVLERLNPDGSPDSSFGSNGITTEWPPDSGIRETNDVTVQPDGGVVVSFYGPILPPPGDPTEPQPWSLGVARFVRNDVPEGDASNAEVRCRGRKATIAGTNGPDNLKGTKRHDVIAGLGGDDRIRGLARWDVVCGGQGDDLLLGGPGRDRLFGGPGGDLLDGGKGPDLLRGGKGRNRLRF